LREYDDWDALARIEQMAKWAEGEEDPDSYEVRKLEPDLPACLRQREFADWGQLLGSFSLPVIPRLKRLVELTLESERASHSVERPWRKWQCGAVGPALPSPGIACLRPPRWPRRKPRSTRMS